MKDRDMNAFGTKWPGWMREIKSDVENVCMFAPAKEELNIVGSCFPDAEIRSVNDNFYKTGELEYDLDDVTTIDSYFDLMVASNVFMYSDDPDLWLENIGKRSRYLWMQDGVDGKRGNDGNYLGEDGDKQRYCFTPHFASTYEHAFDLSKYDKLMRDFHIYGLSNCTHFLLFLDFNAS